MLNHFPIVQAVLLGQKSNSKSRETARDPPSALRLSSWLDVDAAARGAGEEEEAQTSAHLVLLSLRPGSLRPAALAPCPAGQQQVGG